MFNYDVEFSGGTAIQVDIGKNFVNSDIEKITLKADKEIREAAASIGSIILQQRDFYIANRKEIVRQNPESGAGTLFALPTDDESLSASIKLVEFALHGILN